MNAPEMLKLPPHSIDAEQNVIGSILIENEAWDVVAASLTEADFWSDQHRRIWRAVGAIIGAGKVADAVTVVARLDQSGDLEAVGGIEYIGALVGQLGTARNVQAYAKIVRERSQLRRLVSAASDLQALAMNPLGRSADELVGEAAKVLDAFGQNDDADAVKPIGEYLVNLIDRIEQRRNRGAIQGLSTSIQALDAITAGLQNGDLFLLAGRPSHGKSALAMQIAGHAAMAGHSVVVFSLEMSRDQLLERMVSNVGTVNADALRTGNLCNEEWEGVSVALSRLRDIRLLCYDAADMNVSRVRAIARRVKRKHGCALVVLDYLQLLTPEDGENRNAEITQISRGLKLMAKELGCPVLALSQLSRKVEERANKRPVPSDLRDSGALEQDADVIALLYQDQVYDKSDANPLKGIAEIIIAKQRMGRTGTVYTEFAGEYSRFRDMPSEWRRPEYQKPVKSRAIEA